MAKISVNNLTFYYDGSFDNKLIEGNGITTKKLKSLGIECYTIEEFYEKYIENK